MDGFDQRFCWMGFITVIIIIIIITLCHKLNLYGRLLLQNLAFRAIFNSLWIMHWNGEGLGMSPRHQLGLFFRSFNMVEINGWMNRMPCDELQDLHDGEMLHMLWLHFTRFVGTSCVRAQPECSYNSALYRWVIMRVIIPQRCSFPLNFVWHWSYMANVTKGFSVCT